MARMTLPRLGVTLLVIGLGLALPSRHLWAAPSTAAHTGLSLPTGKQRIAARYAQLPLSFEVNQGQVNHQVAFLAHLGGATLFLTPRAAVLSVTEQTRAVRGRAGSQSLSALHPMDGILGSKHAPVHKADVFLHFVRANAHPRIVGLDTLPGRVNYFIGNNPRHWHTNIATYARVEYQDIYPGIDIVFYGKAGHLEYDWIIHPGANPGQIGLRISGVNRSRLDRQGNLQLPTTVGTIVQRRPTGYQGGGQFRRRVAVGYELGGNVLQLRLGAYDRRTTLVVDPSLVYSTYLGGCCAEGYGIAVDNSGEAYVTGYTQSGDFPIQNPFQPVFGGYIDAFVTKFDASGISLVYSTYLGGTGVDYGQAIAVDSVGDAYVTGATGSTDFPTQKAIQPALGGQDDAFVTKLAASGSSLFYSTYLGGHRYDYGLGIAADSVGDAYVTGTTQSRDFPTKNPFQPKLAGMQDAYVAEIAASGISLVYSTYLGGSGGGFGGATGRSIAADARGDAYVAGDTNSADFPTKNPLQPNFGGQDDAFITKFAASGTSLVYSTYLGGGGGDAGYGIAVDIGGAAYVTGVTTSTNFPTKNPVQPTNGGGNDAFVTKIAASGNSLVYSTYLGGKVYDQGYGIAVDGAGNAYVTGTTSSANFPVKNPIQPVPAGGKDAFMTEVAASGRALVYSSYLGGSGDEYGYSDGTDSGGNAYVTGSTVSTDFPTKTPFQPNNGGTNAFVTKISPGGSSGGLLIPSTGRVNAYFLDSPYKDYAFTNYYDQNNVLQSVPANQLGLVHSGIDVSNTQVDCGPGSPVYASADGTVVYANWTGPGFGWAAVIRHGANVGGNGHYTFTVYGQMGTVGTTKYSLKNPNGSRYCLALTQGQSVSPSTLIGYQGASGLAVDKPHVHFMVLAGPYDCSINCDPSTLNARGDYPASPDFYTCLHLTAGDKNKVTSVTVGETNCALK